jgi:hypothetical protein
MEIHNASSVLTPEAFAAFAKPPRKVILQPGEQLYRCGSIVSRTFAGNDACGSPWWIPEASYRQISKTAHRTGQSRIDVARSRLAIATPWNPKMDWLMVIELKKAVQDGSDLRERSHSTRTIGRCCCWVTSIRLMFPASRCRARWRAGRGAHLLWVAMKRIPRGLRDNRTAPSSQAMQIGSGCGEAA